MSDSLYSVGDLCALTGVTRKTLFYYDRIGLLRATAHRGPQNQKMYDSEKLQKLRAILRYRNAGLTIGEIKQVFESPKEETILIFQGAKERLETELEKRQSCIRALNELIREYSRT